MDESIAEVLRQTTEGSRLGLPVGTAALDRRVRRASRAALGFGAGGFAIVGGALLALRKFGDAAEFGTFLAGTVGPTWALAGVLLVYVAFLGQQRQGLIQEAEIQRNARAVRHQQFESTFFQLVGLHHQIVEGIVHGDAPNARQGRDALRFMLGELSRKYDAIAQSPAKERVRLLYEFLARDFGPNLGHYFRNLYHIAKFVHETGHPKRKRYMSFLRAQLSHPELVLLFVNAQNPDFAAWHEYIYKYSIFEPMPEWRFDGPMLRLYADERAYGDNEDLLRLYRAG